MFGRNEKSLAHSGIPASDLEAVAFSLYRRRHSGSRMRITRNYFILFIYSIKKVKESRNRPAVAQRVPGGLDSQIYMTFGT
jgi:hypothetical protein